MSIFSKTKPTWIHIAEPTPEQLHDIVEKYDLHTIVEDDLLSGMIQDKVDSYDDHLFMVTHFPKYSKEQDKYYANPLFILVVKDVIITVCKSPITKLEILHQTYEDGETDEDDMLEKSPYYIVYKVMDTLYDKTLLSLARFNKDIQLLEQDLFSRTRLNTKVLSDLLVKRRNIIFITHMLSPQGDILAELQTAVLKILKEDGDVYFEDLQYKFDKIMHTVQTISENARSLSTTYNALANIQTNSVISLLTIFTASIGILTMITGLYGMNVQLPGQDNPYMFIIVVGLMVLVMFTGLYIGKKRDRR